MGVSSGDAPGAGRVPSTPWMRVLVGGGADALRAPRQGGESAKTNSPRTSDPPERTHRRRPDRVGAREAPARWVDTSASRRAAQALTDGERASLRPSSLLLSWKATASHDTTGPLASSGAVSAVDVATEQRQVSIVPSVIVDTRRPLR